MNDSELHDMIARVEMRLQALSTVGADSAGGITRLAYTPEERAAHELFARWVDEDGATLTVDAAGNSIGVFRDGVPYVLVGSHLDTVVRGGAYDGAAGVVAGLETARRMTDAVSAGVRVVAFAAEEGARFGRPCLGSSAAVGRVDSELLSGLVDAQRVSAADAAAELGFAPAETAVWIGPDVLCFLEVHIEQGRRLESGAARVGLVDTIAGSIRLRLDFIGRADHSGATPMWARADALAAASELVLAAETIARRHRSTVATVGRIEVTPNNVTTVPGRVTVWVDIRDIDSDQQRTAAAGVVARAQEIADSRNVSVDGHVISQQLPVVLAAWPRVIAHDECGKLGLSCRVLPSGAGHDAAIVSQSAPATMLFIPCVDGVSHSPRELASPADISAAAVLAARILERAAALIPTDAVLG